MATPDPKELKQAIDKLVKGKPYFMCRRDGCSVFSDLGRMTDTSIDAGMDKTNDDYFRDEILALFTQAQQKQVTLGKIGAYKDCGSKGGSGAHVRLYAHTRADQLQAELKGDK